MGRDLACGVGVAFLRDGVIHIILRHSVLEGLLEGIWADNDKKITVVVIKGFGTLGIIFLFGGNNIGLQEKTNSIAYNYGFRKERSKLGLFVKSLVAKVLVWVLDI